MFGNVWKVVLAGTGNSFATLSEDIAHVSWQAQHCVFRGRRGTSDASCCAFSANRVAGLREVVTKCKFCGRRGIFCDVLKFGGSLARNVDFEVANVRF